jgi:hypothetical protein
MMSAHSATITTAVMFDPMHSFSGTGRRWLITTGG